MKSVKEHYAGHLASVYSWMLGGTEAAIAQGEAEIESLRLSLKPGDRVLDLGAGMGSHAIPLARRGAAVTAVDASAELLRTLRDLSAGFELRIANEDIVTYLRGERNQYAAILCMGDTLTHLAGFDEVEESLMLAYQALQPCGVLVLTLRDYTAELRGEQRFIPVRSDDTRILTCFLEFEASAVAVHDIVHEAQPGGWQTRVSAYRKLRLVPDDLVQLLGNLGLKVRREAGMRGMVRIIGTRD